MATPFASTNPRITEGVLDFADGTHLAYAAWGPPDAPPLIYCHGSPGCRREIRLSASVCEDLGVRAWVIAFSRPGYGPSTRIPGFGFLDWPPILAEGADRLGIGSFALLGASGGGPFALAGARELGERVTRLGIVAGSAPPEAPGMLQAPAISRLSGSHIVRRIGFGLTARAMSGGRAALIARRMAEDRRLGDADQRLLGRPEMQQPLIAMLSEVFAQGGRTSADEAGLYRRPWGFDVESITTKTFLWYGGRDETVPASAGRWLAERVPNSHLEVWPQHGHFTWAVSEAAATVVTALTR